MAKAFSVFECDSYADARSLNGGYDFIFVRGCSMIRDGGEGVFIWVAGDTAADNDGTILRPTADPAGNWRRVYEQLINVRWFGARGDGSDATAAINAAIAVANDPEPSFAGTGMSVFFPAGNYVVTDSLASITRDGTHLRGAGINATLIQFAPTSSPSSCVTFSKGGQDPELFSCSVRDMTFAASGDETRQKIAIDVWVTSGFLIENINVTYWSGGGSAHPSIAIRTNGHETTTIRKVLLSADRPISIETNPNDRNIDADHFHFQDLTLMCASSEESCIVVASTVHMSNFTMDGTNALVGGLHGIKFVDTSSDPGECIYINISNIRREQSASANGYVIKFGLWGRQMLNVSLKNVAADISPAYGFYFRNVRVLTLENCTYPGTGTALDMDGKLDQGGQPGGGCWDVALLNTFLQTGSTISALNMVRVLGLQRYNTSYAPFMWFDTAADASPVGISLGGSLTGGSPYSFVNIVTAIGTPKSDLPGDLPIGSLYLNQAGGAGTTLYVKEGKGSPGGWKGK